MNTTLPSQRHRPAAPAEFWSQGFSSSSIGDEATRRHPNAADRERPAHGPRRHQSTSPGRLLLEPSRPSGRAGLTPEQILARLHPGHADPLRVLELLIELFNTQHTALQKTVSHKTRHERAMFLRRFFRDLTPKLYGNHVIPIFCAGGYDENSAGRMTSVRSSRRKLMTPMWKNGLDLTEIVRCQFGWQYDGSEARNSVHRLVTYMQAEEAYTLVEFLDQLRAVLMQAYGDEITRMLQQTQAQASLDDDWLNDGFNHEQDEPV